MSKATATKEAPKLDDASRKLLVAIAKANGHPDPKSFADQVATKWSEPDEAESPTDLP